MSVHPAPLVSILCVTWNQREFVDEAIAGMLAQDYPHLEIVVADDGSTDGTVERLREHAARSGGRITVVEGPHVGITDNCNRGLAHCRGTYLAVTAGDDVMLPSKITRQVEWMEADPRRVLCGHDVDVFESGSGRTLYLWSERAPLESGTGAEAAVGGVPYCATAIMVRRSAIPPFGFDPRVPISSDWKLWIDCLFPDGAYGYVEGVLARYRRHTRNITSTPSAAHADRMFQEQLTIWRLVESEYPALAPACRDARANQYMEQAKSCWARGERRAAAAWLARAVRHRPLRTVRRLADYGRRRTVRDRA